MTTVPLSGGRSPSPEPSRDPGSPAADGVDAGPSATGGVHADPSAAQLARLAAEPEFRELKRRFVVFVVPFSVAFLVWYLALVLAASYARGFMATRIAGAVNVAYAFALLQFVTTFGIAALYTRYANRRLDPLAAALAERAEGAR